MLLNLLSTHHLTINSKRYKNRCMDKFSYFDFIAYIVPGSLLQGILAIILDNRSFIIITNNAAIDTLIFIVSSFILGVTISQLGRLTIQPVIKYIFWEGRFYSEIYLLKPLSLCPEPTYSLITKFANSRFGFTEDSLALLDPKHANSNLDKSYSVSHQIFRAFDYYTVDNNVAKKAHVANTLYNLYRSLTAALLFSGIIILLSYWLSPVNSRSDILFGILSVSISVLFLLKTRDEGQLYVQGVFTTTVNSK